MLALLDAGIAPSLRRVINATGVVLHTNLGRAPLAAEAIARIAEVASGYANLEYDLDAGARGHRHVHAERAARVAHRRRGRARRQQQRRGHARSSLAALAAGREVIVSRGELVEIGGGFRVPDVMAQSGAILREVGTTNRTRVTDYAAAISDRTALILRVHPSNFRIEGFTERPDLAELAALAHRFKLPLFEDLGSGWLGLEGDARRRARATSRPIRQSLGAGADLVAVSGDKLLGGPQAGLVVGRRDLIDRVRTHPLMRAVRVDKLTYAALEATLALWAQAPRAVAIPAYRMLTMTVDEIERARAGDSPRGSSSVAGLTLPRHRRRLDDRRRRRARISLADEARRAERRACVTRRAGSPAPRALARRGRADSGRAASCWICARCRTTRTRSLADADQRRALSGSSAAESDASLSKSPGKTPR